MPASAAFGIHCTSEPRNSPTSSTVAAVTTPASRVRPPAPRLTMVASVEPDTGSPPTQAEPMLPSPWPMSSRVLSWRVLVFMSATTEVSSVSMAASTLNVKAGTSSPASSSGATLGASSSSSNRRAGLGRAAGMGPMTSGLSIAVSSAGE